MGRIRAAVRREALYVAGFAFVLAVSLRINTIGGTFMWDDRAGIVGNKDVHRNGSSLVEILKHDFWGQDMTLELSHKSYRPVTTLSYRLNSEIHGHLWTPGFKITNLLIHGLNAALWALLLRLKWRCELTTTVGAALLYSVHPITTECIASIVGRADLLSATFSWLGLLVYPDTTEPMSFLTITARFLLSILLAVLAALSKENGVTVLGLYVLYEGVLSCARRASKVSQAKKAKKKAKQGGLAGALKFWGASIREMLRPGCIVRIIVCALVVGAYVYAHIQLHGEHLLYPWTVLENDIARTEDETERMLTYSYTHAMYLYKMLFPVKQSFDYGFKCVPHVVSWEDPLLLVPMAAYGFVLCCILLGLLTQNPGLLWLMSLMIVPWLPASQIFFPVGVILGERLLYMPVAAMATLVAMTLHRTLGISKGTFRGCLNLLCNPFQAGDEALHMNGTSNGHGIEGAEGNGAAPAPPTMNWWRRILVALYAATLLSFSVASVYRSHIWNSEQTLFSDALKTCPDSVKVLTNTAFYHLNPQGADTAVKMLEHAIDVYPYGSGAQENLGLAFYHQERFSSARRVFRRTLALYPEHCQYWVALQEVEYFNAMLDGVDAADKVRLLMNAVKNFEAAQTIPRCERFATLHHSRALVAMALGQLAEAQHHAERAEELNPTSVHKVDLHNTFNLLALAYKKAEKPVEALPAFEKALGYAPESEYWKVLTNIATLRMLDDLGAAKELATKALELAPREPEVLTNFGYILEMDGQLDEALKLYEDAYTLQLPDVDPQVERNYQNLKARMA
mmetsp:Transcript_46232/g.144589  ORF Transcript_46232/g.144589 Transcript_46232/m.144589 type:complete len:795 (-) Transcript_46232:884-3268(-)